MLAHYLAVALAKFRTAPFTTAANILTLALGLACFIAAYGIADYWRSGDAYHANASRTFVVGQSTSPAARTEPNPFGMESSAAVAKYLVEDFPEFQHVARILTLEKVPAAAGSNTALLDGGFADPAFLEIFDFDFLAGDARHALDQPGSVVLTTDAAERLFGDEPALGRTILLDAAHEVTVSGVIAPVRQPSFMGASTDAEVRFDLLSRRDVLPLVARQDTADYWFATQGWTFVVLKPDADIAAVNGRLPAFAEQRIPADQAAVATTRFQALPVSSMTTRALDNMLFAKNALGLTATAALLGLGALTLLVASINYANLSTAQSAGRVKEIGLRKVVGAGRVAVAIQSWLDALLLTAIAAAIALGALAAATPAIKAQAGIDLLLFWHGLKPIGLVAGLIALVALVAGAYPALVLSRVVPAEALRSGRSRSGPRFVSQALVGVQFATASFLLIVLTVAQLQRAYLEREALGADKDPVVVLNNIQTLSVDFDTLAGALAGQPGVVSVSETDRLPWTQGASTWSLARSPEPGATEFPVLLKHVAHDYFETVDLALLAGRVFERERETESHPLAVSDQLPPLVIDRAYAQSLGFASPSDAIGELIYMPERAMRLMGGAAAQPAQIVGVVETDLTRLSHINVGGSMYAYAPDITYSGSRNPLVRLDRDEVTEGLQSVERVWRGLAPNVAPDIQFTDQLFEQAYRQHARIGQLFALLVSTAFIIASIGQLGIAVHVVSRRRHEIGVRKVLGSSSLGVAHLLLTDFSKPALIANLAAWPAGYLAAQIYLAAFAHRVELTPAPFALSLGITLLIAWAAVIGEVLKAASVRPAEVLRHA